MRCRIFSVAAIWYGRITSRSFSAVKTQNLVRTLRRVCFAKKVLVKSTRSVITLFFSSAQYEVNSKLPVLLVEFLALSSLVFFT